MASTAASSHCALAPLDTARGQLGRPCSRGLAARPYRHRLEELSATANLLLDEASGQLPPGTPPTPLSLAAAAAAAEAGVEAADLAEEEWGHADEEEEDDDEEEEEEAPPEFTTPPPKATSQEKMAEKQGQRMTAWLHLEPSGVHIRRDAAAEARAAPRS